MSEAEEQTQTKSAPITPPKMVAVRKRTRRRRSDPPVKRKTLNFLLVSFALVFILAAVPEIRSAVISYGHQLVGGKRMPAEVVALLLAGLVLIYLIPGVEDKVLIAVGLRKPSRSRNSRR